MTKLGHYLREWREYRGLTQTQLSLMIGMDRSYISKIETGDKDYIQYIIERIAIALRCEVADLIGRLPGKSIDYLSVNEETAKFDHENLKPITMPEKRRPKKKPRSPAIEKK